MKTSRIIWAIILVLLLSGSLSCQAWRNLWCPLPAQPQHTSTFADAAPFLQQEPSVVPRPLPTRPPAEPPPVVRPPAAPAPVDVIIRPRPPAAGSENNSNIISRIFPCAECGIVRVDKAMPQQVEPNLPFDYSIRFTNLTDMALTGVIITEDTPDNFRLAGSNPVARKEGNRLVWEVDLLEPRATKQITVSGVATDGAFLKHCTTVVTQVIPACASVTVISPKLELTRTAPAEALICDQIPLKYVVANTGTGSVQNVKLVETFPAGLQTADGKTEIIFDAGTLTPGLSRQFAVELRATKSGKYVCQAVASSPVGFRAESPAVTMTVGQPVLALTQTIPNQHYLGRPLAYDITVTNKGDGPAKNTVIENGLPAPDITSIKATSGAKLSGPRLIWQLGTIAAGSSRKVRVSYMPTKAGTFANSIAASAHCADTATASAQTLVAGVPGVLLEVGDIDDPVEVNGRTTYMITVTNQGFAVSTNIRIACSLEENVQYVSSSGPTAGTLEGSTITFAPLSALAPKGKATWRVVVTAVKAGDSRFKTTMITDQLTRPVEETEATRVYD